MELVCLFRNASLSMCCIITVYIYNILLNVHRFTLCMMCNNGSNAKLHPDFMWRVPECLLTMENKIKLAGVSPLLTHWQHTPFLVVTYQIAMPVCSSPIHLYQDRMYELGGSLLCS
jgi:hypothetical protein